MILTSTEKTVVLHRLEVPECIHESMESEADFLPIEQDDVIEACNRLITVINQDVDFEPANELEKQVLLNAIEGTVLDDIHPRAVESLRIKVGLDQPKPVKPPRAIPADTDLFKYNDGGRSEAGYKGHTGDCVCRAICITTGLPYQQVYDRLALGNSTQRRSKKQRRLRSGNTGNKTAAHGIYTRRKWFKDYMRELGFEWVATMEIGTGCQVHLKREELPAGKLIVALSKHYSTMIDGVLNDTYDCSRDGTRCVYGYWRKI